MSKHLYIGSVEYTRWGDKSTLSNAVLTAAAGQVEQFGIGLQNSQGGAGLPPIPRGHVPVIYLDRYVEEIPDLYDVLFSGTLQEVDGSDASWTGMTSITVATPIKPLKVQLHSIVFYPGMDHEYSDTSRVRRLGQLLARQLPDFDFTTYVAANNVGNITYPEPIYPLYPKDPNSGDLYTEYNEMSAEDIMRAIATDPGWFTDANYPAQARNWWIEGDFTISGDPTSPVKWFIHYQNIPVPGETITELLDAPNPAVPGADIYLSGATYREDYSSVIRQVHVSGPLTYADGFTRAAQMVIWTGGTIQGLYHTYASRAATIYKRRGVDGVWDTGAISHVSYPSGDFEIQWQIQEQYLQHDTFQRDDNPFLTATKTNQGALWQNPTVTNPMGIRGSLAVPWHMHDITEGDNMMIGVIDCYASTCNLRTHLARCRIGQRLIFRYIDLYNYWYVAVKDATHYAVYKMVDNTPTQMGADIDATMADMQEIKVSLRNSDIINVIEVYIDDAIQYTVDDDTFWDSTFHGIGVDGDADVSAKDAAFYDFQCTHLWGDKAVGIGDDKMQYDSSDLDTLMWVRISFGVIHNSDGTIDLIVGGDPLDSADWEPDMYDTERDYAADDRFKVATEEYVDTDTGLVARKVEWLKQPDGQGEWLLLAHLDNVVTPVMSPDNLWQGQFAAKEKGAAITNALIGQSYSNMFVVDPETVSPMYGSPYAYPANGLVQSDFLTTYIKRQRIAQAIFRAEAEGKTTFVCETFTNIRRGLFRKITNRRAGWTNPVGGPDKRKVLMCTSVQRVETGNLNKPKYKCTFGNYVYSSDDPGRVHLLRPQEQYHAPLNMPDAALFDGFALTWNEHVITGTEEYGQKIRVIVVPYDDDSWTSKQWPSMVYDGPIASVMIPPSMMPKGGKAVLHWRTETANGTPSDWSSGLPFVTKGQDASDRLSTMVWTFGDGQNPISADVGKNILDEHPLNQAYRVVSWSMSFGVDLTGVAAVGDMQVEVQCCSAEDKRSVGNAGFASLRGSAVAPFIQNSGTPLYGGSYNEGYDTALWAAKAHNLKTGDILRVKILSADTAATTGSFTLNLQPVDTPFVQTSGNPVAQPPMSDGPGSDAPGLVDSDGAPLIGH